jgi:hypothetical protein
MHRQHVIKGPEIVDGQTCGKSIAFVGVMFLCTLILICGSSGDVFCNFGFHCGVVIERGK